MIFRLFRTDPNKALIENLHEHLVALSRQPELYTQHLVPDTLEGRFEALALHYILLIRALKAKPAPGPDLAQDMTDRFFASMESDMREMGVGDVTIPKRMNRIAQSFMGRAKTYQEALEQNDMTALTQALARNITGETTEPASLAAYVMDKDKAYVKASLDDLLAG